MYSGVTNFLNDQDFGGSEFMPKYQLLTWQASVIVAGFQTVAIPLDPTGNVLFIQIEQILISTDGLGGVITFRDSRIPTPMFNIINAASYTICPVFNYLIKGNKFTMVSNSATVQFALGYIPISKQPKRAK
jgi:hypothetical protein